jgi:hypothetical protein
MNPMKHNKLELWAAHYLIIIGISILVIGGGIAGFVFRAPAPEKIITTVDLADDALSQLFHCMEKAKGDSSICEEETSLAYKYLKQLDYEDTQKLLNKHHK